MRLARSLTTVAAVAVLCTVGAAPASADHPPPFRSTVTVTSATLDRAGNAFVTVTATCAEEGSLVDMSADVRRDIGRFKTVHGWGWAAAPCENGVATATIQLILEGRFRGGPVTVQVDAESWEIIGSGEGRTLRGSTERTLRFSRVR